MHRDVLTSMHTLRLSCQEMDVDGRVDQEIGLGSDHATIEHSVGCAERSSVQLIQELGSERREQQVDLPFRSVHVRHRQNYQLLEIGIVYINSICLITTTTTLTCAPRKAYRRRFARTSRTSASKAYVAGSCY
jgi:hypothetical protein